MAARKKSSARKKTAARKKTGARRKTARRTGLQRVEANLPPKLRPYARRLRSLVKRFETQLDTAGKRYRKEAAKLLRDAGNELEQLESRGERSWKNLDAKGRRRVIGLLAQLQKTVREVHFNTTPARSRARKAARGAKRAMRKAAARVSP
jgi:hypothetical protein